MIYLGHKNLHQQPKSVVCFVLFFFPFWELKFSLLFTQKVTKKHLPVFVFVSLKSQNEQNLAEGILQMENKSNQANLLFLALS